MNKQTIIKLLRDFINQRPGFELGNYDTWANYQSDYRPVLRAKHDAHTMLSAIEYNDSITVEDILNASKLAYLGRLSFTDRLGNIYIEYCAAQYFPAEYRRAVCAVLSTVLWSYFRDHCECRTGDDIRKQAHIKFGKSLANRWFS